MTKKIELNINERIILSSILGARIISNDEFIEKFKNDKGLDIVIKCTIEENKSLKSIVLRLGIL